MSNPRAEFVAGPIRYEFDGAKDDLLTAGLGAEGLRGPPPVFADPARPTPLELRRRAIYMNYRGLVDVTAAGGFGSLFGADTQRVAGVEYLVSIRTPDGCGVTTAMLQIPKGFDAKNPCLLAVASSGSRGIYGALPTAGEWGLRNGWAVVHTDKGTGTGIFDVDRNRGIRIDGTIGEAGDSQLSLTPAQQDLAGLRTERPHSLVFKHPHSGMNVEANWGEYLLQAIDAAFQLFNGEYPSLSKPVAPSNTLIVVSGISNGGATALRALESDEEGWIDGAVVSEPSVTVTALTQELAIVSPGRTYTHVGASLYDYVTEHMLLQPCATLAETDASAPFFAATQADRANLEQWCRDLHAQGVLTVHDVPSQAREARERLLAAGILPEALLLGHVNIQTSLWITLAATYAAAYARMTPAELPCGVSFAATDPSGTPRALTDEEFACLFSDSTGIAPTAGIDLVMPDADGRIRAANLGSAALAICLGSLEKERTMEAEPSPGGNGIAARIAAGQKQARMTARLQGRPVIAIHGRADGLIAVNPTSRAYYALNQREEAARSGLRYYEIEHGQHFDASLMLPAFAERYVPLQPHLLHAMDLMAARLRNNAELPPSQVVRSRPRQRQSKDHGEGLIALSKEHLGELKRKPGADAILVDGSALRVP